jgi:hypothetical protein
LEVRDEAPIAYHSDGTPDELQRLVGGDVRAVHVKLLGHAVATGA